MDQERKEQLLALLKNFSISDPDEKALSRYDRALTHSSASKENNERMEFFGDCVLDFLISEELYESFDRRRGLLQEKFPGLKDEALLTDMLHEITNDRNLAAIAKQIPGFDAAILRGSGQALTTSIRAGACEAFIAALYEDRGVAKTRDVIKVFFRMRLDHAEPIISWKNKLQEHIQKQERTANVKEIIEYRNRETGKVDDDDRFVSEIFVKISGKGWERRGIGAGRSEQEAQKDAARDALEHHGKD